MINSPQDCYNFLDFQLVSLTAYSVVGVPPIPALVFSLTTSATHSIATQCLLGSGVCCFALTRQSINEEFREINSLIAEQFRQRTSLLEGDSISQTPLFETQEESELLAQRLNRISELTHELNSSTQLFASYVQMLPCIIIPCGCAVAACTVNATGLAHLTALKVTEMFVANCVLQSMMPKICPVSSSIPEPMPEQREENNTTLQQNYGTIA